MFVVDPSAHIPEVFKGEIFGQRISESDLVEEGGGQKLEEHVEAEFLPGFLVVFVLELVTPAA